MSGKGGIIYVSQEKRAHYATQDQPQKEHQDGQEAEGRGEGKSKPEPFSVEKARQDRVNSLGSE